MSNSIIAEIVAGHADFVRAWHEVVELDSASMGEVHTLESAPWLEGWGGDAACLRGAEFREACAPTVHDQISGLGSDEAVTGGVLHAAIMGRDSTSSPHLRQPKCNIW